MALTLWQERVRALIDVLLTFDDFPTFAEMMVEHNMKMQRGEDSAMGSLAAGGNQTQCVAWRAIWHVDSALVQPAA